MDVPKIINDILSTAAKHYGPKVAIVFESWKISFSEMERLSKKVAKGLFEQGVQKGDRVALVMKNCAEVPITLFGSARIGAIPTFLNAQHKGEEIVYALSNCEPKVVVVEGLILPEIAEQIHKVESIQNIYVVGRESRKPADPRKILPFEALLKEGDACQEVQEDDVGAIVYTAGTEGRPKGAMLSHKGVIRDILDRVPLWEVPSDFRTLIFAPFYHIAGFRHLLMSIYRGNMTYVIPFHAEKVLKLIHNERINYIVGAPAVYHLMFQREDFKTYDLSSVRVAGMGGAPSTPGLVARVFEAFPQALVYNGYGQTELTGGNIDNIGEDFRKRPESVGKIHGGHELKVVDEEGNPVPTGEVGEVIVRGEIVFKGYWNNPEATSKKIRNGWLYTGDLGRMDAEGFLCLVGRKADMIIRGGENIYPQEVENIIEQHPGVEEVAVIGVPDEVMGEEVKAFVSWRKGATLTVQDLKDYCLKKMAKYKVPKYIDFVDELPHVSAGKIDRKQLRSKASLTS